MNACIAHSFRPRATLAALGFALFGTATTATAQTRPSLADLAAQIAALQGQVASLTQANSNLQGQLDSLNANLGVVQTSVAGAKAVAQDAQNRVTTVEYGLTAVQANSVLALDGKLSYDAFNETARFRGVDVQVVSGYAVATGRGNLIIGFNGPRPAGMPPICSIGTYDTEHLCLSNSGVWAVEHKSGSHNLVIGDGHAYSGQYGAVIGFNNAITNNAAVVTGGANNIARGYGTVVVGGMNNSAKGQHSVVGGGFGRTAHDALDWVAGDLYQDH